MAADKFELGVTFLAYYKIVEVNYGHDYVVHNRVPEEYWPGLEACGWYTDDGGSWSYRPNLGEAVEWVYPTFSDEGVSIR
jgi:hypothetical protein